MEIPNIGTVIISTEEYKNLIMAQQREVSLFTAIDKNMHGSEYGGVWLNADSLLDAIKVICPNDYKRIKERCEVETEEKRNKNKNENKEGDN
jgi:hypothetical protein